MKPKEKKKIIVQPSHAKVYQFIAKYIKKNVFAPMLEEISKGTKLTVRQVYRLVEQLEEMGYIKKEPQKTRGLSILKKFGE